MDSKRESLTSWIDDNMVSSSTELNEIEEEEVMALGTIIAIVFGVVLAISLIFGIAIFIDWRQQKLSKVLHVQKSGRPGLNILGKTKEENDDEESFADKMEVQESSSSSHSVQIV